MHVIKRIYKIIGKRSKKNRKSPTYAKMLKMLHIVYYGKIRFNWLTV